MSDRDGCPIKLDVDKAGCPKSWMSDRAGCPKSWMSEKLDVQKAGLITIVTIITSCNNSNPAIERLTLDSIYNLCQLCLNNNKGRTNLYQAHTNNTSKTDVAPWRYKWDGWMDGLDGNIWVGVCIEHLTVLITRQRRI